MEMSEVKKEIKDYVRDHYKYYGWYPYDVQVGDVLYSYEQYMDILSRQFKNCLLIRASVRECIIIKYNKTENPYAELVLQSSQCLWRFRHS